MHLGNTFIVLHILSTIHNTLLLIVIFVQICFISVYQCMYILWIYVSPHKTRAKLLTFTNTASLTKEEAL